MAEQFVFASMSACTATTIVHPLDVIRVKMQISKAGEGGIVERITNGPKGYRGLYAGLSAGLLRQLTYGTGRIGVYNVLLDAIGGPSVPFTSKVAVGITAGSFGGLVGNPAEVVLVRMAAGGRGYKHVCDALSRIVKEEGPSALLTGVMPTVVRAAVITSSQLATFTEANTRLKPILGLQDGVFLHFCAAMVSGAVTVAVSMPFDVVKTAMQNQKTGAEAVHASSLGCALQMVSKRGPLALWNGALPFWFKVGPHTVISLLMVEQLRTITKPSPTL